MRIGEISEKGVRSILSNFSLLQNYSRSREDAPESQIVSILHRKKFDQAERVALDIDSINRGYNKRCHPNTGTQAENNLAGQSRGAMTACSRMCFASADRFWRGPMSLVSEMSRP